MWSPAGSTRERRRPSCRTKTDEPETLDDAEALVEGDEETEDTDLDAVPEEAEA